MAQDISQGTLDDFATAWSRLDRARPQERGDLGSAVSTLADWIRHALELDDRLFAAMGLAYLQARAHREGGRALLGLRHVWALVLNDHPLDAAVLATPGADLFWDMYWVPHPNLPKLGTPSPVPEQEEAYQSHLEGRAVRTAASAMTTFLLAVTHDARRVVTG